MAPEKIKDLFDLAYMNTDKLTVGQTEFIDSLKRQFKRNKELSEKQTNVLREITAELNMNVRTSMKL